MKRVFESDHIEYVEVSEQLVPDYLRMINDIEHVTRFIGMKNEPVSEEKERAWVRKKLANHDKVWSMIEKRTGAYIGNLELIPAADSVAELGIAITAAMQEKGFGTEAIRAIAAYGKKQFGLQRIVLKVYPFNKRAIHVYEKCGFREYDRNEADVFMELDTRSADVHTLWSEHVQGCLLLRV